MNRRRANFIFLVIFILIVLTLAGMIWANLRIVALNPRDSQFVTYWTVTRRFMIDGASPYSDTVAIEIQEQAYGSPAQGDRHPLRYTAPLFSSFLFLPLSVVDDYFLARAIWLTLSELALFGLSLACLKLTRWQPPLWLLPFYFIFVFWGYPGLSPLLNGDLVIWATLALLLGLLALREQRDELAGAALALALIHPRPIILAISVVLFWAFSHRRWIVLTWFGSGLFFLTLLGIFMLPDWPLQYLRVLIGYPEFPAPNTLVAALREALPGAGRQLGLLITVVLAAVMVAETWVVRGRDLRWLVWTISLILVLTPWVGIQTTPTNLVTLLLPLALVFSGFEVRNPLFGRALALVSLLLALFGLWGLYFKFVDFNRWPAQPIELLLPLSGALWVGLYWVRWWAIRPKHLFIEELRAREEL